jgi:hypothetical protein
VPRLFCLGAMGLALLVMMGVVVQPRSGITEANARLIEAGMSREQVEAILGGVAHQKKMYNAGRDCVEIWAEKRGIDELIIWEALTTMAS